jgi:hypothetical protein
MANQVVETDVLAEIMIKAKQTADSLLAGF